MSDLPSLLADLKSGNDDLAERAVSQLVALNKEAIPALLILREAENEDVRWWAFCALAQMPEADVTWFFPGLQDSSGAVRESAAMALNLHPHPSVVSRLIVALDDTDRLVATLATNALIGIGRDSTPELISTMENGTPAARIEATRALSEIRDPRAIPAFMNVMENDSVLVRYWAEQGLENLGVGMVYFKPE
jgi:HEAT repeat protein